MARNMGDGWGDAMRIGEGNFIFEVVENWGRLPAGETLGEVSGIATGPDGLVYVLSRRQQPVVVFDRAGRFVRSWGKGIFARPHGICIGPDGMVYCADDWDHTVRKLTPEGVLLMTIGVPGQPSDTGYDGRKLSTIRRGGPPFNRPTGIALAGDGSLFITDGYGNARVHHFAANGQLLHSWGQPGAGPGEFKLPHSVLITPDGALGIADRENSRLQFFTPDGGFISQWPDINRPNDVAFDSEGRLYVLELGPPGYLSIFTPDGQRLIRIGAEDGCAPGSFYAPHGIWLDPYGDIYVGEVVLSTQRGARPDCHALQKLIKI